MEGVKETFMQKEQISLEKKRIFSRAIDEKILVVKKNILFAYQTIDGLKSVNFDSYQALIHKYKQFLWRSKVEEDPSYKQIIPYLVFNYENKFFVMRRKSNASETRLQNKYSIGIGGHIRKKDLKKTNIIDWSEREFEEEIDYRGSFSVKSLGILNDESNPVGQVHTGFVFLLKGDSNKISIRDEHKEGMLLTLDECFEFYGYMENWSKIVLDYLKNNNPQI
jgi:predicted NUDIX family phosphoesterase